MTCPSRRGKWQSVYHRFSAWRKDGTFGRILRALRLRLDKAGQIDWDLWLGDSSSGRASRAAAGAGPKGAKPSPKTTRWVARKAGEERSST